MHPMRLTAFVAVALSGCAHPAYGPSSDQRLESATSEKGSAEGAEVKDVRCNDLAQKLKDSRNEDKPEAERLQGLIDIFTNAKERFGKLDDAVAKNPDLVYSADGESIKANLDECRAFFADARSDLDRYIREVCDLPVIQELQGGKTVNVARIDFGLLRGAITTLDPDDKDVLMGKIDAAEKKVGSAKKSK
jgi:hypothetical protein